MIAGLRGLVRRIEAASVVLSVGPVDVRLAMPTPALSAMQPGQEVEVRTYLYVREDQLALYGFTSQAELEIFEHLLSVSGIGPKGALGVLSTLTPGEIRSAIAQNDARTLTRAPGVGARAAARIVTDLLGKLDAVVSEDGPAGIAPGPQATVLEALINMGYAPQEARRAVEASATTGTAELILREALARLAERQT
ncbi:MAG: holliday junction helicase RuvA [Chloroflexota bacterium]|jgi:Holliday junction DNA helicase RuvA|nr:holliday junction helicase RuvA [Chloroflexota bacterium]